MSNLSNISYDKIENDIMIVLYANIDTIFTQYSLFNKLISDKYDLKNSVSIHPNFKSKFLLVMINLMARYKDIHIFKDNGMYNIVCVSDNNVKIENLSKFKNPTNSSNSTNSTNSSNSSNSSNSTNSQDSIVDFGSNEILLMQDLIFELSPNEYMNWSEPSDANTIFHELILNNNTKHIERLINDNKFNFSVVNKHNQTPIDLINSPIMNKTIIMCLQKNLTKEKENSDYLTQNIISMKNDYESTKYKNKIIINTNIFSIILTKIVYNFACILLKIIDNFKFIFSLVFIIGLSYFLLNISNCFEKLIGDFNTI